MQLTMSSGAMSLRSITSRTSSSVADRIASASFSSTVMAPRSARSCTARDCVREPAWAAPGARSAPQPFDLGVLEPAALARVRGRAGRAGRTPPAPARPRGGRPPRTCAAPGACGPRAGRSRPRRAPPGARGRARSAPSSSSTPSRSALSARGDSAAGLDPRPVDLLHAVAGMGQQVGQLAVVGQQDQPGRVGVEPPHRVEPPRASAPARPPSGARACRAPSRRRRAAC